MVKYVFVCIFVLDKVLFYSAFRWFIQSYTASSTLTLWEKWIVIRRSFYRNGGNVLSLTCRSFRVPIISFQHCTVDLTFSSRYLNIEQFADFKPKSLKNTNMLLNIIRAKYFSEILSYFLLFQIAHWVKVNVNVRYL